MLPEITRLEFNAAAIETTTTTTTLMGKSFNFDFAVGDFVLQDGGPAIIDDTDAIRVWLEKILRTERFQYKIYKRDDENEYGLSIEGLIGGVWPRAFVEAELKREITEAVTRHPNISSISNLTTEQDGALLKASFTINLSNGGSLEVTV